MQKARENSLQLNYLPAFSIPTTASRNSASTFGQIRVISASCENGSEAGVLVGVSGGGGELQDSVPQRFMKSGNWFNSSISHHASMRRFFW